MNNGDSKLSAITVGGDCCAFGHSALVLNTGSNNSAFGSLTLDANTLGTQNCAFGVSALGANLTSSGSSAYGYVALLLSTGADNSAFGSYAGRTITTGDSCTFLGATSDTSLVTAQNSTAVGFGAVVAASNEMVLGNTALTLVRPGVTDTVELGNDTYKWERVRAITVVTGDLELKDEKMGTDWAVREAKLPGEDKGSLYAVDRVTKKKYRLVMEEVA